MGWIRTSAAPAEGKTNLGGIADDPVNWRREGWLVALAVLAAAALRLPYIISPRISFDDFLMLNTSWDWSTTVDNLFVPHNDHAMPLGRIMVWALLHLDGSLATLPFRCSLQGPIAAGIATALVYLFVRRETGQPLTAVLTAIFFGVTLKFGEAIVWYAASFWLLGFINMLLALLAAQSWRRSGRRRSIALCVLFCALAPGWYAGGVLAGPFCVLYLLPRNVADRAASRSRAWVLLPLLGTLAFLAVSLPQNADRIIHAEHYKGETAFDSFNPWFGLICTCRAIADTMTVNWIGSSGVVLPEYLVPFALIAIGTIAIWWNWHAPRPLILLGLGMIICHYGMTFSTRFGWHYFREGRIDMAFWTRYHLVPWCGMTLLFANGLTARLNRTSDRGDLTIRRCRWLVALALALYVSQTANVWVTWWPKHLVNEYQHDVLAHIDEVDRICRVNRIGAVDARNVLAPIPIPFSANFNGWEWLRGSGDPAEHSPNEVKKALEPYAELK